MNKKELARLFYRQLEKTINNQALETTAKVEGLFKLFQLLFLELTKKERISFTTFFARVAYCSHKFGLEKRLQFYVHLFRKRATLPNYQSDNNTLELGKKVLAELLIAFFNELPPSELIQQLPLNWPEEFRPADISGFQAFTKVLAVEDDPASEQLLCKSEEEPENLIRVAYNLADRNDNFNASIQLIKEKIGLPVALYLIDSEIDTSGTYRPKAFIIDPDYLLDITAISECFQYYGPEPELALLKKFLPFLPSPPLMIGNIANFFLDELMHDPEQSFKALFPKVFQLNPLAFCLFDNRHIKEIMNKSQKHFVNLKKMVLQDFEEQDIKIKDCYLEPSFYSDKYGIQGRLDVFYREPDSKHSAIVELKSGGIYQPNVYGISAKHYIQTLLYDLLVRSTYGKEIDPACYILYSGADEKHLRFAPAIRAQQLDALQVRNYLMSFEYELAKLGTGEEDLLEQGLRFFNRLRPDQHPRLKGFAQKDLARFETAFSKLSPLEKKYFTAFSGFIAREQQLAKTGVQGMEKMNGQASLWLNSYYEKQLHFEILSHLEVAQNLTTAAEPIIIFNKSEATSDLANFRKGDIAVLYPYDSEGEAALNNQVFKATIIDISSSQVTIRLRSRQFNTQLFDTIEWWALEHDLMDSSFLGMYRGLFAFAESPPSSRQLLLSERAPQKTAPLAIMPPDDLTEEQQLIFRQILATKDYFLLWGPPGTGKTSMMLKYLAGYLYDQTEEHILLLAYTNRAVDEICAAIESYAPHLNDAYIRIGSRYSTGVHYQDHLLSKKIEKIQSRKELKAVIQDHRIVVSTVASVQNKVELFKLKSFDTVIIDEASQILEPSLLGLLPNFKRFILVGDHKQLPAVVTQPPVSSAINDQTLQHIGLYNMRNSLFERLFKQCQKNGWHWAYAQLSHQGRMHQDIMQFPNEHFYHKKLQILPTRLLEAERQQAPLPFNLYNIDDALESYLSQQRLIFIPTPAEEGKPMQKTNSYEALLIGVLVEKITALHHLNKLSVDKKTIGVITPYRAQIAQIQQVLDSQKEKHTRITIDTVERYQGGAREVIIISLCTNSYDQIQGLTSLSDEGVDRKLNVALTRAKSQLIVLGNPGILLSNPIYRKLIEQFPLIPDALQKQIQELF